MRRINGIVRFLLMFVLFFTVCLNSPEVYAESKQYHVADYTINVMVNGDGSTDIEESLTYRFKGQFNGVLRDVDFSGTKGISNISVHVQRSGGLVELKQNQTSSIDYSGQPGSYNFVKDGSLARFKIFEQSSDQDKTFVIRYRLAGAVTKYKDTAEFNRKLIDTGWQTRLDNIYIKVVLPEGASKEELKVFAHGPLTGVSSIVDARTLEFEVPTVSPGTFVETLVLFPNKLVPDSKELVNEDALPRILENEGKLADEANIEREEARQQVQREEERRERLSLIGRILAILLMFIWLPAIIYLYRKYDKELANGFQGKYYRELPGEYTPAEMSVLMSFGSVSSRDIMATLMDLVRKRQLLLDVNRIHKKGLFGGKDIEQYTISLNEKAPAVELKSHEAHLISWFIGKIGDGLSVNLEDIKSYVKTRSQALKFKSDYDLWCAYAVKEAEKNKFFDQSSKKGRNIGILSGVGIFFSGLAIAGLMFTPLGVAPAVLGVILIIFSARIKRRTAYGSEQHSMWLAFKNFLKDFSRMNKAEIPSIVLWEHYLVYAISLGVAKEVIKQLPLVFTDEDLNDRHLTFMYGASYGYFAGFTTIFDNTIHTVEGAITSAVNVANSANSSGSGGGGGFSGGSSGGGGGGGGGGAF